jgi:tetratricopeptide (TPR) repeat protein
MFKLGLMSQARRDFEMLSPRYPKELAAHFNLALTLLQLGEYDKALDAADIIVKAAQKADGRQQAAGQRQEPGAVDGPKSQQSSYKDSQARTEHIELLYDTHMLRAQCFWRTETAMGNDGSERYNALEAVRNFNIAHRYNAYSRQRRAPALTQAALLLKLRDLQYKEMRLDIKEEADWVEARRSRSFAESSMSQMRDPAGGGTARGEAEPDHLEIEDQ